MPKLYSSNHIIKILQKKGFKFISCKGSHIKMRKIAHPVINTIIPANKKEIPYGTFKAILLQTKLNEKDFNNN